MGEGVLRLRFHEVHESRVGRQIAYVGTHSFREIDYGFVGFLEEPGILPFPVSLSGRKEAGAAGDLGNQEHAGTDGNLGSLAMERNR